MDTFWNALLNLNSTVKNVSEVINYCSFSESGGITINEIDASNTGQKCVVFLEKAPLSLAPQIAVFQFTKDIQIEVLHPGLLQEKEIDFLKKYLPLCFLSILARKKKRTISIAHFAQTLDGKIATSNGDSKWIGNQENLIHAHRMRALCDGILIGNHTLKIDKPRLTVRLVPGKNPKRVVVGTSCQNYACLMDSASEEVIVIGSKNGYQKDTEFLDFIPLKKINGVIPPSTILENLYRKKGINSLYIEGGSSTTSCFLDQKSVDILQLHIAPMLFGSGKNGINLPIITQVNDAIKFSKYQFHKIGSEIMFTGYLNGATKNE